MKKLSKSFALPLILAASLGLIISCAQDEKKPENKVTDPDTGTLTIEKENGFGYTLEGNVITLSAEGTEDNPPKYTLSGTWEGKIVTQTKGTVLTLNGVTLTNANAPAIEAKKKVEIKTASDTVNTVSTTGDYNKDAKTGAINGEKKVEIGGSGTIVVSGTVCHGIKGNDVEVKGSGTYTASGSSEGSAINCNTFEVKEGKDFTLTLKDSKNGVKADVSIKILSGNFILKNLSNGFKTDLAKDDEPDANIQHYIYIADTASVEYENISKKKLSSDSYELPAE